jgi:predicted tellurium resistance membrane protein TerC
MVASINFNVQGQADKVIDLGFCGHIEFTGHFLTAVLSIVVIDLILAGDNAVVIAMAVRSPAE